MYMPSIFEDNFVDDVFDSMFSFPFQYKKAAGQMNTDISDCGDSYQIDIELPGFAKEDVKAELKDGYLTIAATKDETKESNEEQYIRRERYTGQCSRSYYVGDQVTKEDIEAKFDNGVLSLKVPKKEAVEKKEENYILIE